jgi:hypothetical protein
MHSNAISVYVIINFFLLGLGRLTCSVLIALPRVYMHFQMFRPSRTLLIYFYVPNLTLACKKQFIPKSLCHKPANCRNGSMRHTCPSESRNSWSTDLWPGRPTNQGLAPHLLDGRGIEVRFPYLQSIHTEFGGLNEEQFSGAKRLRCEADLSPPSSASHPCTVMACAGRPLLSCSTCRCSDSNRATAKSSFYYYCIQVITLSWTKNEWLGAEVLTPLCCIDVLSSTSFPVSDTLEVRTGINPLTPKVNPSAQRFLTKFFTGNFAYWTLLFIHMCVKNQQIHQLFIQFINYVW